MEEVYEKSQYRYLYTKKIDMKGFFAHYSSEINKCFVKKKKGDNMKFLLDIDDDEYTKLKFKMEPKKGMNTDIPKAFVPKRRFLETWPHYELPPVNDIKLVTLKNLKKENREEKYKRMRSSRYFGKVFLEVDQEPEDSRRRKTLSGLEDYAVCLRIQNMISGIVGGDKKYMTSQELWIPGQITLNKIKDRIICEEDFQYSQPELETPLQQPSKRKMDINKFGMFYIGDDFFIDKRFGSHPRHDYSSGVREWMQARNLNPGNVHDMQDVRLEDLAIRLGYPYLYMHQGKCEHLITFTDSRLLKHRTDLLFLEDYPLLKSFASLRGKFCILCLSRHAKFCVTGCETLPYDVAYVCHLCAYSYLFTSDGKKRTPFTLYKYVDRTAII